MTFPATSILSEPFDHLTLIEPYMPVSASVVEVVAFEYPLAALIWLHRTINAAIRAEGTRLQVVAREEFARREAVP